MEVNPPKQEHLLALKVMRLTKPTLFTNIPVTCEEKDLPGDLFNQLMRDDPSTVHGAEVLMLGEMLTLPQNFGNIFLGETFSSYISVHNDSNQVVRDVLVKADLQTSSQRLNLSASNAAIAELKPDCCIDDVIHHEVKEIGTHILVCAVSYTTQGGEKMYFRKFFKFQVLKPLDVKTKFYNAEELLLALHSEVIPGSAQGTIWDAGNRTQVTFVLLRERQMPYPLCHCSGPRIIDEFTSPQYVFCSDI